jgi:hypothetical protein
MRMEGQLWNIRAWDRYYAKKIGHWFIHMHHLLILGLWADREGLNPFIDPCRARTLQKSEHRLHQSLHLHH